VPLNTNKASQGQEVRSQSHQAALSGCSSRHLQGAGTHSVGRTKTTQLVTSLTHKSSGSIWFKAGVWPHLFRLKIL